MTNEELVREIQAGDLTQIPQLWEQIRKFAESEAGKYCDKFCSDNIIEKDDLVQEAFLILSDAVRTYRADEGALFLTWYDFYLRKTFKSYCGFTSKQRQLERDAVSLSDPVPGTDDLTYEETLPDNGTDLIAEAEETIYTEQLHQALETAITENTADHEADVIRRVYWNGETIAAIADEQQISASSVSAYHRQALFKIREHARPSLEQYLIVSNLSVKPVSPGRFQATHSSEEEAYIIAKENLYEKYYGKAGAYVNADKRRH